MLLPSWDLSLVPGANLVGDNQFSLLKVAMWLSHIHHGMGTHLTPTHTHIKSVNKQMKNKIK